MGFVSTPGHEAPATRAARTSTGCRLACPSIDMPSSVHSRARCHALRFRGANLEIPFRPRGFAPPRRLPPLGGRGLVASRCQSWGSPRFLRCAVLPQAEACEHNVRRISRDALYPSKNLPSPIAVPRHRGRCPPAVLSCRAVLPTPPPLPETPSTAGPTGASASRPCSIAESVAPSRSLPTAPRPILPGLCSPSRSFRAPVSRDLHALATISQIPKDPSDRSPLRSARSTAAEAAAFAVNSSIGLSRHPEGWLATLTGASLAHHRSGDEDLVRRGLLRASRGDEEGGSDTVGIPPSVHWSVPTGEPVVSNQCSRSLSGAEVPMLAHR